MPKDPASIRVPLCFRSQHLCGPMRRFDERLSPAPNCHCKDDHIARTTLHGACHDYARFARRYGTCAARASNNQVRIRFSAYGNQSHLVRKVAATGERTNQMGEHPDDYLSYSADGRRYAIGTSDRRVKPREANPVDEERVKLHQTMFAYAGT
jgi:hypothetical protein